MTMRIYFVLLMLINLNLGFALPKDNFRKYAIVFPTGAEEEEAYKGAKVLNRKIIYKPVSFPKDDYDDQAEKEVGSKVNFKTPNPEFHADLYHGPFKHTPEFHRNRLFGSPADRLHHTKEFHAQPQEHTPEFHAKLYNGPFRHTSEFHRIGSSAGFLQHTKEFHAQPQQHSREFPFKHTPEFHRSSSSDDRSATQLKHSTEFHRQTFHGPHKHTLEYHGNSLEQIPAAPFTHTAAFHARNNFDTLNHTPEFNGISSMASSTAEIEHATEIQENSSTEANSNSINAEKQEHDVSFDDRFLFRTVSNCNRRLINGNCSRRKK